MIKRPLDRLLCAVLFVLIQLPARSCGPDWPQAVFVKQHGPDTPYDSFARGRLGVPQIGYRTRHLVIAYRYLNHLPLSGEEQQAAVKANNLFQSSWDTDQQEPASNHAGFLAWINDREAFGPVDNFVPPNPFANQNGWQYNAYFETCLDNAFANAAHTLEARKTTYGGARSPDVVEWVRGQDNVFVNCNKPAATPAALSATAPRWLRFDRAYQSAAALLYQRNYEAARIAFSGIAGDGASPWSVLSRYLVARVMVEQAIAREAYVPGLDQTTPVPDAQRLNQYLDDLRSARANLLAAKAEARMQPYLHAIDALIDRVNARLEPDLQTRTLALRLTASAPDPNFYQDVLDLSYLLSNDADTNDDALNRRPHIPVPPPATEPERRAADMLHWIKTFRSADAQASLEQWDRTHENTWLLASLAAAKPEDARIAELLAAATAINEHDPAFVAVTYHRLRLASASPRARAELLAVLPQIAGSETPSTRNLFAALDARSAPTLETWLKAAARKPVAEASYNEEEPFEPKPSEQPCGPALQDADTPLFAPDVATVLNTRMPLRLLTQAAAAGRLPPNLRFQVAQAAWTRAVLLDRPEIAARLSPILTGCNAKWQPVLSAYDHARSGDDRRAAALFALMRFASTEPNVREGNYRVDGFAKYSYYRDNWWCVTVPPTPQQQAKLMQENGGWLWGFTPIAHPDVADPPFLTARDRAEAADEVRKLQAIPQASVYLPSEAIAWQAAHPHDSRAPELLGQAFRVTRNACYLKGPDDLEHRLFLLLHRQYPRNRWTVRYRTWE